MEKEKINSETEIISLEDSDKVLARLKQPVTQGGHHSGVIGAEGRRRQKEVNSRGLGVFLQHLAQAAVGRHPAADHQAGAALLLHGQPGPAREAVHHRGLKAGGQIAPGCVVSEDFRVLLEPVGHRGLEAAKGKGEGLPMDLGPGEVVNGGIAVLS